MRKNKKQSFFEGTIILIISTIIVKILGALFKIPLAGILGGEGMGYFMTGYSIFAPVSAVALGGITVAMSKSTASYNALGKYGTSRRLVRVALLIFTFIGILMGGALYFAAEIICTYIDNPLSLYVVQAMCPAVTLCFISSTLRGYFEGCKNIYPTAFSQMAEAIIKLLCGYSGAFFAIRLGTNEYVNYGTIFGTPAPTLLIAREIILTKAAAWAAYGVSISTFIGVCVLIFIYKGEKPYNKSALTKTDSFKDILYDLFKTATPAGVGAIGANIPGVIDLATIINTLSKTVEKHSPYFLDQYDKLVNSGISISGLPNFLYGAYTGMAVTLVNIIPSFISPISINALPIIAEAWSGGNRQKLSANAEEILKLATVIAMPMGFGLSIVSKPVLLTLFSTRGYEAEIAASLLVILGISAVFTAISIPLTTILQGIGRSDIPVKIMFIAGILKLFLNKILISIPQINIFGAAYATLICSFLIFIVSLIYFLNKSRIKISFYNTFIKPAFCTASCIITSYLAKDFLTNKIGNLYISAISIILGGTVYVVFLFLTGTISRNEINSISF